MKLRLMQLVMSAIVAVMAMSGCRAADGVQKELEEYADGVDAAVGIAVVFDDGSFAGVNADRPFPMMSVMKFPLSMQVSRWLRQTGGSLDDTMTILPSELHRNTYSPMMDRYVDGDTVEMSVDRLLVYALGLSDNNASDILMSRTGGPEAVSELMDSIGVGEIAVKWNEDAMHVDIARSRENLSTPRNMVALLKKFDTEWNDAVSVRIKSIMENCATGSDRLAAPLDKDRDVIGHKTGTGDVDPETGKLIALNDVGWVRLANGRHYWIAVFVGDSGCGMDGTAAVIAGVSDIVARSLK